MPAFHLCMWAHRPCRRFLDARVLWIFVSGAQWCLQPFIDAGDLTRSKTNAPLIKFDARRASAIQMARRLTLALLCNDYGGRSGTLPALSTAGAGIEGTQNNPKPKHPNTYEISGARRRDRQSKRCRLPATSAGRSAPWDPQYPTDRVSARRNTPYAERGSLSPLLSARYTLFPNALFEELSVSSFATVDFGKQQPESSHCHWRGVMKDLMFAVSVTFCVTLILNPADSHAAKTHKMHGKRASYVSSRGGYQIAQHNKIYRPADLLSQLRLQLALPRPTPVTLPTPPVAPTLDGLSLGDAPTETAEPTTPNPSTADAFDSPEGPQIPRNQPATTFPTVLENAETAGSAAREVGVVKKADGEVFEIEDLVRARQREYEKQLETYHEQVREYAELQRQETIYRRFSEQVTWFSQRIGFIHQSIDRARPYLYLVIEELEKNRLPLDLALLPIVESGYQPQAVSPKDASGLWQFIPTTGQIYGLTQNEWYDGRLDIAASTHAAARYLAHLRRKFQGDWLLALAGYNCGEKRVEQAVAANRAAELPTDFWALALPEETKAYVPKLLALSAIFSNPAAYRLILKPVANHRYLAKVRLEQTRSVDDVARLAGLSPEQFLWLNPGFINGAVAVDKPSDILLPRTEVVAFQQRLEDELRQIEPGPTRFVLAALHGEQLPIATPAPASITDTIREHRFLDGSNQHRIPRAAGSTISAVDGVGPSSRPVKPVSAVEILPLRPTLTGDLKSPPRLYSGGKSPSAAEVFLIHDVVLGETIEKIAKGYNVDPALLRTVNKLKPRKPARPGDKLVIPFDTAEPVGLLDAERTGPADSTENVGQVRHSRSQRTTVRAEREHPCGQRC
jgi:LysM repeat protein